MSNQQTSIHEFDFNLICEYFSSINRQGPGSDEVTEKALSFIDNLNKYSKIADLGCGTGAQTIALARNVECEISALDLFPLFIEKLKDRLRHYNFGNRVNTIVGSMDKLPFEKSSLDLIWSEGAIYNIGFKNGLSLWRDFLKDNGYVAVTEASWFTEERPKEIEDFWVDAYSEIDTIPNKIKVMQECGYLPVATFILPEICWMDNFYMLQKKAQELFLEIYPDNETARMLVENQRREFELYKKYGSYYGYVFYIGRKI